MLAGMYEIMVYWMEPDAAGNWRMLALIPEDRLAPNIMQAVDWVKEGRASHFSVNKTDKNYTAGSDGKMMIP